MKRMALLLVLLVSSCLAGCGLVHTRQERHRRFKTISALQARMIVDDWDYFWMVDRPSYLTQWHISATE